ncbi:ABC transporter ATP-binding protein [Tissierella sp. MSJ-40]|uniref:ABC transporter ATP-binding protein n=1 Tax=Tissierella simiarum TaxID=2841534 RepID=A0ABS6E2E4_9FIRM|nr:ABC transporter ATP-binding protein [Tissierella simiarum]MBU5437077.1 ABC transporter ATP-binding protein [Tissierella simiarum]
MTERLLEVKNLETSFYTHLGEVRAIRNISFDLDSGETLGIVGESGSGKSVTVLSIMNLLQHPGRIRSGEIIFKGKNLVPKSQREMRKIRGKEISMIFQDPMTSLNPVFTVGNQIVEAITEHQNISKKEAKEIAINMLDVAGIPSPEKRFYNYPHEMSGGMRQRAMIAMALSCEPDLLIADEPTTALDVTIQAQILRLMKDLTNKLNTSIIFITHDLGVIADLCKRVIVMYGGLIMEVGGVRDIFYNPQHPYTKGLLRAVPSINLDKTKRLYTIHGNPPDLLNPPIGCPYAERCHHAMEICLKYQPQFFNISDRHKAACWRLHEDYLNNCN